MTFYKGLVAGTFNFIIGYIFSTGCHGISFFGYAIICGALCYGLSLTLYIGASQKLGASRSQIVFATAPFWGVVFAGTFLRESISLIQIAAGIIFAISIVLLLTDRHGHHHRHDKTLHIHPHSHDDGHHNHEHSLEDTPRGRTHSHYDEHEEIEHSHPHYPDLHHRHLHLHLH